MVKPRVMAPSVELDIAPVPPVRGRWQRGHEGAAVLAAEPPPLAPAYLKRWPLVGDVMNLAKPLLWSRWRMVALTPTKTPPWNGCAAFGTEGGVQSTKNVTVGVNMLTLCGLVGPGVVYNSLNLLFGESRRTALAWTTTPKAES